MSKRAVPEQQRKGIKNGKRKPDPAQAPCAL